MGGEKLKSRRSDLISKNDFLSQAEFKFLYPPGHFYGMQLPLNRLPVKTWYRVHNLGVSPVVFAVDPRHRFSHPRLPDPILYLGMDLPTCLAECFLKYPGQSPVRICRSEWQNSGISAFSLPDIQICDLSKSRTIELLQADAEALKEDDLEFPQAWALAIQEHPANCQGVVYRSRFNQRDCLALFARKVVESRMAVQFQGKLVDNPLCQAWLQDLGAILE